jgi:hypothetical protein
VLARPVIAAAAELARLAVIAGAVILGLAVASGAALVAYRVRRGRRSAPLVVHQVPPVTLRAAQAVQEPRHPAIGAPREVHFHFHGVSADEEAAIIQRAGKES